MIGKWTYVPHMTIQVGQSKPIYGLKQFSIEKYYTNSTNKMVYLTNPCLKWLIYVTLDTQNTTTQCLMVALYTTFIRWYPLANYCAKWLIDWLMNTIDDYSICTIDFYGCLIRQVKFTHLHRNCGKKIKTRRNNILVRLTLKRDENWSFSPRMVPFYKWRYIPLPSICVCVFACVP